MAAAALIAVGLLFTGGAYAAFTTSAVAEDSAASEQQIEQGEKLFAANCATCHGVNAAGTDNAPSLIGVGAASVDFQVGTGRMPAQANGPQMREKEPQLGEEDTQALADYIASLGPGPAIPADKYLDAEGDATNGAELFRINCAMCHNVAGVGGALTQGKFAPSLVGVTEKHIYEAMVTGPQNMPVFNDANLSSEDKRDIITSLKFNETNTAPGGFELGSIGPVSEGIFIWIIGLGGIVAITVWLTARPN
jgi:ubiquinol-cytochrome c reductase cytochrome c subunit